MASAAGEDLYYTAAERIGMANDDLTAAQSIRDGIEEMQQIEDSVDYNLASNDLRRQLVDGSITAAQ